MTVTGMDEYIKREAAIAAIMSEPSDAHYPHWYADKIKAIPAANVAPLRYGRRMYDSGSGKYFCSACDEYALSFKKDTLYGGDLYEVCLTDYCPSCGAKMDLEVSNGKSETVWYAPQGDSE